VQSASLAILFKEPILKYKYKKLISRWESERELSLLRHRTRTTKYDRLLHKFRHNFCIYTAHDLMTFILCPCSFNFNRRISCWQHSYRVWRSHRLSVIAHFVWGPAVLCDFSAPKWHGRCICYVTPVHPTLDLPSFVFSELDCRKTTNTV